MYHTAQPFEINTLTGGSGKIRSTFSDCLSALGVLPRTFDCRIYSQIASVPVAELGLGGLVVVLAAALYAVWELPRPTYHVHEQGVVLVTGASSGIGK